MDIHVTGKDIPTPIQYFHQINFPTQLALEIKKLKYEIPTPIQCQALPILLSGYNK
jgi:superfamily II DNA/RNA helicase